MRTSSIESFPVGVMVASFGLSSENADEDKARGHEPQDEEKEHGIALLSIQTGERPPLAEKHIVMVFNQPVGFVKKNSLTRTRFFDKTRSFLARVASGTGGRIMAKSEGSLAKRGRGRPPLEVVPPCRHCGQEGYLRGDGSGKPSRSRGLCKRCYARWRFWGSHLTESGEPDMTRPSSQ